MSETLTVGERTSPQNGQEMTSTAARAGRSGATDVAAQGRDQGGGQGDGRGTVVASTSGNATAAAKDKTNPFAALAQLIRAVNDSLEGSKMVNQAPRWVRVVRLREYCAPVQAKDGAIAGVISQGLGFLITAIAYIQKFTLTAEDLLRQADAARALFEISAAMLKQMAEPEFFNSITAVLDMPPMDATPLAPLGSVIGSIEKIVDKIPEPEDLRAIGQQLYRMLVIEQLPTGDEPPTAATDTHIDIGKTGKMRLIQWGLAKPFAPLELSGGNDPSVPLQSLGARRLWQDDLARMPQASIGRWINDERQGEMVFGFSFTDANRAKDIDEVKSILSGLGYYAPPAAAGGGFDAELARRLRQFQKINDLPVTGRLDNYTINQLLHLRYDPDPAKGYLRRAKPFSAGALPPGFDDTRSAITDGSDGRARSTTAGVQRIAAPEGTTAGTTSSDPMAGSGTAGAGATSGTTSTGSTTAGVPTPTVGTTTETSADGTTSESGDGSSGDDTPGSAGTGTATRGRTSRNAETRR